MGITFYYSGRLAGPELLPELIDEVRDIVKIHEWDFTIYETQFPSGAFGMPTYNENIYGISFTPPNCETVSLCFLSNGRMSSLIQLKFYGKTDEQIENKYLYLLFVKTQFAGVEVHQFIIHLFRYLNKKYFVDFKILDDSKYWETNDVTVLKTNFKKNTDLIEGVTSAIKNYPILSGETIEMYFERLMKQICNKKNNDNDT